MKSILASALGIRVIVSKSRKIYLVENVKIHFDLVKDLGTFIEVEAIDRTGEIGIAQLEEQCSRFAKLIGIDQADYIAESYGDMINM
ncbi:MAG TPA: CYTH domain-containing protein [Puia sp.]|nr:CYTH domain-containing protein [Puia sp.]